MPLFEMPLPRMPLRRNLPLVAWVVACGMPSITSAQPYVAAKLGYAKADFALAAPYDGVVKDRAFAYSLDLGYDFTRHFAAEVGLTAHGGFDGRATPCPAGGACALAVEPTSGNHVRTYTAALVPKINVANLEFFGKAGYYQAAIHAHSSLGRHEFTNRGVLLGAGARWTFNRPWSVSVEAERFDNNLYQVTAGFGWKFNLVPH